MTKTSFPKKLVSLLMCVALIANYIPLSAAAATPVAQSAVADVVVDPGTAHTWEAMMGTDADGNRYAGRVWVDKSLYKDGDTAILNTRGEEGSSFQVALDKDEAFQIVFSALGSTMSVKNTVTSTGPMDVVLVLDNSDSMSDNNRMRRTIEAANKLLENLLENNNDVRLGITAYGADAATVLPFSTYNDGVELRVNNYNSSGVITAYNSAGQVIDRNYKSNGYALNTNIQAGFELAMDMLANATNTRGRKPVAILLTDGAANTALDTLFDADKEGAVRQIYHSNNIDPMIALSTLLSNAYNKASVGIHYGVAPMVYGIGVDLSSSDGSNAIIDPAHNFNSSNSNSNIRSAYNTYTNTWLTGSDISQTSGTGNGGNIWGGGSSYSFRFGHEYPQGSGVTDSEVAANIHYVDSYYPVASADLESVFDQIYQELLSGAFNPISSTTTAEGGTGVKNTPLIYVDFIGKHMEIKEIQAVSLFGSSYGVMKNADGTYTVDAGTGKNPTTNENWNTAQDIRITVTEENGIQKLEIRIDQEILPIIMEQVVSETMGEVTTSTITELIQQPLRVFYTVGVDSDILLPNGEIDVTKIQGYQEIDDVNGTVSLYGGQFGVMNPADSNGIVWEGDAHVGFKPSAENRYYYHQKNQGIFTQITNQADGSVVDIPENEEYGIVWEEDKYDLSWMTYEDYLAAQDTDEVYTYVTYYHPTPDATDAASAAEEVTYLVYMDWGYLKESVAFYDANTGLYLNEGKTLPVDQVASTVAAYKQANPDAELYAVLGVGSLRTSRLHNMTVIKGEGKNYTGTAEDRYAPEYTHETAANHNGNDVVVWLGNNGIFTLDIDTGIALTKEVTEAIGNPDDTYSLTVTVPAGVDADPVVLDAEGNAVSATYSGNVLTVPVKAGQTVYVSGIPGGTVCAISEIIKGDYYIENQDTSVRVPLLSEALNGTPQFAAAKVTNAPNKYGNLTIVKDIAHNLVGTPAEMAQKEFTFQVQLAPVPEEREYSVDKNNASAFADTKVIVANDGTFEVTLKDNESITILGLPEHTVYTVTETSNVDGYTNTSGVITGTIQGGGDHDAHFINAYAVTPIKPQITVTGRKELVDNHNTYTLDEDFTFVLSQYTGDQTNPYTTLATQAIKKGETYTFRLDQLLTQPLGLGDHYFRVTEQAGATPGMTYDATRGLFVVHVTDTDADGVLRYEIENLANTTVTGNTVTKNFTNTYDVDRTHVDINITKELENETGVELPMDLFHFVLVNKADADDTHTVTTDRSGKATIRIPNLAAGTYAYTLSEVDGGMSGMDYDTTVYGVNITVTNISGVLTAVAEIEGAAQANGDNTLDVSFRNAYTLADTTYTIGGTKVLNGRDPITGEFTFALYQTDSSFEIAGNPIDTAENTGKTFAFDLITYNKVGAYYYSVKEIPGNVPGVTHYDTTHYHITVHVGVSSEDPTKLAVTGVNINKIGHNSDTSGKVVFVNEYQPAPTEYTLGGHKVLHGRAPRNGEFSFELYEGTKLLETVTNKVDGTFAFKAIPYTQAGTYTYTIKEAAGTVAGVTYDGVNTPVTVTVTVTDTNGVLSAQANVANTDIVFENTYTPAPAQITFNGTKTLKGGNLADNAFTFELYQTDNSFDIADADTVLLASEKNVNGVFSFGRTMEATGTYYFVILEDTADPAENVVYDRTRHKFVVRVSDIGDGQLKAAITNVNTGVSTAAAAAASSDVSFVNATFDEATEKTVYMEGNTATQIDGKKVDAGDILTYFITYTNYTGETVVADIMDIIPQHTAYVEDSATLGGTYAGAHINWILNVAAGQSVTVSFQVKVLETEAIVANTAVVRDGVNTYYTNEVVNHSVENALTKDVFAPADPITSIHGKQVSEGDELLYKITFTNASAQKVNMKITDKIPGNTTYVAGSADHGGVFTNGAIEWNLKDIPAWGTVTVTFKVTVNAGVGAVTIENKATATDGTNNYETNTVSNFTVQTSAEPAPTDPTPTEPAEPTTPAVPSNPQTGDNTNLNMLITLLVLSCGGFIALATFGRKKETEEV